MRAVGYSTACQRNRTATLASPAEPAMGDALAAPSQVIMWRWRRWRDERLPPICVRWWVRAIPDSAAWAVRIRMSAWASTSNRSCLASSTR